MPIPKPRDRETEDTFLSRCVSTLRKEDPTRPQDQILAICYAQWRKHTE